MSNNLKKNIFLLTVLLLCSCADYDLLNQGDPESVTLSITSVTDSTVTLHWSKSLDKDFKNYKLYFSRNETVDATDSLVDSLSFRIDTVRTVRNLIPATRYYFRVLVNTGRNLFSPSNEVYTVTSKDTVTAAIKNINLNAPESITDSSVTLRWSHFSGTFDSYRIFVDTTGDVTFADSLFATVYPDTSKLISKLISNKTYWFRVYAKKDTSYLGKSNSIEVNIP